MEKYEKYNIKFYDLSKNIILLKKKENDASLFLNKIYCKYNNIFFNSNYVIIYFEKFLISTFFNWRKYLYFILYKQLIYFSEKKAHNSQEMFHHF